MKILIAIPCGETLDVNFVRSITNLKRPEGTEVAYMSGSLVYEARNNLGKMSEGFDYILWLDSDMSFDDDLIYKLLDDIEGRDFVTGLYFTRKAPFKPCVFERCDFVDLYNDGKLYQDFNWVQNVPNEIFEVKACGFGCVLMRASMFFDVLNQKGLPFTPLPGFGEDLSFCIRARQIGYKLYCDPRILLGHTAHIIVGSDYMINDWNQQPISADTL